MTEQEMGAAPADETMADLLSEEEYHQPQRGEIRTGVVVSVGPNEIVVDVGVKREGLVSPRDLERLSAEERAGLSVGDEVPVYVLKPEDQDGNLIVSLYLAQLEQDWQKAEEYLKSNEIFEGKVTGYNKGGLVVGFGRIRGFVPASQVADFPRQLSPDEKINRLTRQVGRDIAVRVIEVDRKRKRLIMSEQVALREWRERQRRKVMDSLTEGQVVHGVVTSLADFGAFVDLGGTEGLVHISEISRQRIKHPREVLHVGDEVDVYVLKLDQASGKIGLSLRRLQPDPWTLVSTKYAVGQRVEGMVTNVVDFGVFAQLEGGIEGLVHVSELSNAPITHPRDVVARGQWYLLEIVKIDPERQRIGLSLKRVPADEQTAWHAAQAAPASESVAPADEAVSLPAGEVVSLPAGEVVSSPADEAASLPAGEVTISPADEAASSPAGDAAGESQMETIVKEPVA
jgi:small subunit ribosomal protein S1